ncbi:MAG: 1-deoxy-D-xylulose-5-phosphate synthase [Bacteroidales bacterium]|nr:1-deoxy-D-xylulose-5-phosphate synthase [Bacteroidales bacterium]MDZ4203515.1 1-deoxy-D-xylulose-5-phosphate synthase [Bacteroidales bacterium]
MATQASGLLSNINYPGDLRLLSEDKLPQLCDELRQFIIDIVSSSPGHLGASLGVVELSVALHYIYNTPYDRLIWDVGHQAYAHKILTGRRDIFHTHRKYKGISGFPCMSESEYDAFGTGHSSTSISAALGMAIAAGLQNDHNRHHVAIIGDGSMTGGMALEALNNTGVSKSNVLVILNDNGIAIDQNVGAIKEYLTNIVTSRAYNRFRDKVWNLLGGNTKYGGNSRAIVKQIGNAFKTTIFRESNLFEAFNMRYFGPVDGHDVIRLTHLLRDLKNIPGPKLLHVITVKGKGYVHAEKDQITFHAPGQFDRNTGEIIEKQCPSQPPKYQEVFGKTILELAEMNPKIVGITPAMPTGCSLTYMIDKMPHRVFDVGIAEQHAVTFSAGMAAAGLTPFCNIYSSFMQRAYDQVIHDVALQQLPVIFCLDRGGLVGEDGATHHGAYDLAYFRAIPGLTIAAPMNEQELRNMMYTAQYNPQGPLVIRYPKGRVVETDWQKPFKLVEIGKGRQICEGNDLAIITIGHVGNFVNSIRQQLEADEISMAHFDIRFLKPIDEELLHKVFKKFNKVITVEDGTLLGGLGSAVLEFMNQHRYHATVSCLGIPDRFIGQGTNEELHHECGFDPEGIYLEVKQLMRVLTDKELNQADGSIFIKL